MTDDLEQGITRAGSGYGGRTLDILGQTYHPKSLAASSFSFETHTRPGQFVPVHVHPTQEEFILVLEGTLDLKLDGAWSQAAPGDLVRMPRGLPHGYFNRSDADVRALFWVSPAGRLPALFEAIDGVADPAEVVRLSAEHEVEFLPEDANA